MPLKKKNYVCLYECVFQANSQSLIVFDCIQERKKISYKFKRKKSAFVLSISKVIKNIHFLNRKYLNSKFDFKIKLKKIIDKTFRFIYIKVSKSTHRTRHRFFPLTSGGVNAATIASSKTFFSPFFNNISK